MGLVGRRRRGSPTTAPRAGVQSARSSAGAAGMPRGPCAGSRTSGAPRCSSASSSTTMLLGLVVVLLLGSYLFSSISDGLEQDRIESAKLETSRLTTEVQGTFDQSDRTSSEADLNLLARQARAERRLSGGDNERYLVLTRSLGNTSNTDRADPVQRRRSGCRWSHGPARGGARRPAPSAGDADRHHRPADRRQGPGRHRGVAGRAAAGRPLRPLRRLPDAAGAGHPRPHHADLPDRRSGPGLPRRRASPGW